MTDLVFVLGVGLPLALLVVRVGWLFERFVKAHEKLAQVHEEQLTRMNDCFDEFDKRAQEFIEKEYHGVR